MATSEQIDGFARCVNQACDAWDQDAPIPVVKETVQKKGYPGEAFAAMVISESTYLHAADDADLPCPECGMPRALLDKPAIAYPKRQVA